MGTRHAADPRSSIFKAYDIRGVYPDQLDEATARDLGLAAGLLWPGRVVVGHDARNSSPAIRRGLLAGLRATGCEILDAGLLCTPLVPFAVRHYRCALGISITASHNPPEYNGFKLFGRDGLPMGYDTGIARLKAAMSRPRAARTAARRHPLRKIPLLREYALFLERTVGAPRRKLTVVVDAANGPAGKVYTALLRPFARVLPLHCEPDGNFPAHEPDPAKVENLSDLRREVRRTRADAGLAYDGDGDRLGVVDDRGRPVPPEKVFGLLLDEALRRRPRARVVHDVLASRFVDDRIRSLGGVPVECRVGHTFISQRMAEARAAFAGELSGHYYFEETGYADDALFASLRILRILAEAERPLSSLVDGLNNPYISRNFRVPIPEEAKAPFMRALKERAAREHPIQTMDGVKVLFPEGWALLRPSNTEPKLSIAYEASDGAAFKAIEAWVKRALGPYRADGRPAARGRRSRSPQ